MPFCPEDGPRRLGDTFLDQAALEGLSPQERLTITWEISSVSFAIAAASVLAIDFFLSRRITWSWYPFISLALLFVAFTAFRFFHGKPAIFAASLTLALPLYFVGLDWAGVRTPSWSLTIALPITLVVEAAALALLWAAMTVKRRGTNLLAFCLMAVSAICLCIEATLDLASGAGLVFTWSAIVAFGLLPVALFLLYIHHRLSRKTTLRKLFHL